MPDDLTLDKIEADPDFRSMAPVDRRKALQSWMGRDPDFNSMDPTDRQVAENRILARHADPVSTSPSKPILAPISQYPSLSYLGSTDQGRKPMAEQGLLDELHDIASSRGWKLGITSAFRPVEVNRQVAQSGDRSRHIHYRAVDVATINDQPVNTEQGQSLANDLYDELGRRGFSPGEHGTNAGVIWGPKTGNIGGNHMDHMHVSLPPGWQSTRMQRAGMATSRIPLDTGAGSAIGVTAGNDVGTGQPTPGIQPLKTPVVATPRKSTPSPTAAVMDLSNFFQDSVDAAREGVLSNLTKLAARDQVKPATPPAASAIPPPQGMTEEQVQDWAQRFITPGAKPYDKFGELLNSDPAKWDALLTGYSVPGKAIMKTLAQRVKSQPATMRAATPDEQARNYLSQIQTSADVSNAKAGADIMGGKLNPLDMAGRVMGVLSNMRDTLLTAFSSTKSAKDYLEQLAPPSEAGLLQKKTPPAELSDFDRSFRAQLAKLSTSDRSKVVNYLGDAVFAPEKHAAEIAKDKTLHPVARVLLGAADTVENVATDPATWALGSGILGGSKYAGRIFTGMLAADTAQQAMELPNADDKARHFGRMLATGGMAGAGVLHEALPASRRLLQSRSAGRAGELANSQPAAPAANAPVESASVGRSTENPPKLSDVPERLWSLYDDKGRPYGQTTSEDMADRARESGFRVVEERANPLEAPAPGAHPTSPTSKSGVAPTHMIGDAAAVKMTTPQGNTIYQEVKEDGSLGRPLTTGKNQPVPISPIPASGVVEMAPKEIVADPDRFQFKRDVGQEGVSGELKGIKTYDPELGGVLSVWRDPQDGKTYVINGHHRLELAKRTNTPTVDARYIKAANEGEARTTGALINIAEGRGTSVDAAKVFRETGMTPADLNARGVSIKGPVAREGLALTNLPDALWGKVYRGEIDPVKAAAIGGSGLSHTDQLQLSKMVESEEAKGRPLSPGEISQTALHLQTAPSATFAEEGLFGPEEITRSLAPEKGRLANWVIERLGREKRTFGTAGKQESADILSQAAGNQLNITENARVAKERAQAIEVFRRLSSMKGTPVNEALNSAATAFAKGDNPNVVRENLYKQSLSAVSEAFGRREGESAEQRPGAAGAGTSAGEGPGLFEQPGTPAVHAESVSPPSEVTEHRTEPAPPAVYDRGAEASIDRTAQGKRPWEMTQSEFEADRRAELAQTASNPSQASAARGERFGQEARLRHRGIVEGALADGKPVPPEVLADYPDLARGAIAESASGSAVDQYFKAKAERPGVTHFIRVGDSYEAYGPDAQAIASVVDKPIFQLKTDQGSVDAVAIRADQIEKAVTRLIKADHRVALMDQFEGPRKSIADRKNPEGSGGLHMEVIPGASKFVEKDVAPVIRSLVSGSKDTIARIVRALSPRTGVRPIALDEIMKMKGERDKAQFILEATMAHVKKTFDRMPQSEAIAFMDRYKRGEAQSNRELQAYADLYHKLDDDMYKEITKYKPDMAWKEDHFRILWKVIPGKQVAKGFEGLFRKPFQGTKGFMLQATLPDVSTGIAMGGVPVSYNPQVLFELAYADAKKYTTAQGMAESFKKMGLMQFVKFRKPAPDDFVRLDDAMARVHFPVPQGMVNAGEWWIDKGAGRLLNNFLSRDYIREAAAGRGLLWLKNNMTAAELSLSMFHATFESLESMSSAVGMGLRKIYNVGLLQAKPRAALSGIGDILAAGAAPFQTSRLGGKAIKYMANSQALAKATGWDDILIKHPEAKELLDDLFTGGGKLAMHEDYKINSIRTMRENWNAQNYIGAVLRAVPAVNELAMKPLFEVYIPRLKVGLFLKEFPLALEERSADLAAGKVTREQLARKTWDFVEDRLGEMNFDNLFWNRTMKTALQLMFRSVTWKLGNLRASLGAVPEQATEVVSAARQRRVPRLEPKMAWLLGQSVVTAALSTVIMKAATGKYPEEPKDLVFPRIDKDDPDQRISTPTYWKDMVSLWESPTKYATGSLSSEVSRTAEIWKNKDFFGNQIYSEDSPAYEKAGRIMAHYFPVPFSISSFQRMREKGEPVGKSLAGFAGFTKAPRYVTQSPADEMMQRFIGQNLQGIVRTPEQAAEAKYRHGLVSKGRRGEEITKQIEDDLVSGRMTVAQAKRTLKNTQVKPGEVAFKMLSTQQAEKVWDVATDKERQTFLLPFVSKIHNAASRGEISADRAIWLFKHIGADKLGQPGAKSRPFAGAGVR